MIEYQCVCGGLMTHIILTSVPPINRWTCQRCGRIVDEREGTQRIVK